MLNRIVVSLNKTANGFDAFNQYLGRILFITPLLLILVQFSIVLMVYIFAIGSIMLQESLQYINALMFMGAVGHTALQDEHVRVDIFYSNMKRTKKDWVNLLGSLFFLMPTIWLLWSVSLSYVGSSFVILEGSSETGGLPFVYLLKGTIILFCISLSTAALSTIIRIGLKKTCAFMQREKT